MADETTGWRRHLTPRHALRTSLFIAAALSLPFCAAGIFMDDYYQQLVMEGAPNMPGTRWELFTFAWGDAAKMQSMVEHGPMPWWSLPLLRFSFFRPLSCALANLDVLLFGRTFALHHLHSTLWYLALVAVVAAVLRRALGKSSTVAALATVLFAADGAHALATGWLANRNALIATTPVLLGVLAHMHWRERGAWWALPLSLLGYAVGLCGGEAAVGALAYLAAYELTMGPGSARARVLSLFPALLLGVGYVALYKSLGSGASGSGIYVDPLREPLQFLVTAPAKALALTGAQFLGTTADFWLMAPSARPALVVAGVLALVLMTTLSRRLWSLLDEQERRGTRWLALGAALSVIPVLATFPLNRLLLMPSIGGSVLIALVLVHGWNAAADRLSRASARLLFVTTIVVSLLGWPTSFAALVFGGREMTKTAMETTMPDEALSKDVMVFVAPDPATAMYANSVRLWNHKPAGEHWVTLSFSPHAHRLTRTADDTVELEVIDGRWMETVFEELMRAPTSPVPAGMKVKLHHAELTVIGFDHGLPNKVSVHFDQALEQSGYTFVRFVDGHLAPLELPTVGQSIVLPKLDSLLGL